ncbi:MAG: DUF4345 domain-containing protein [Chloroflexi bacterium]|nr:DUF4345 domain-containing protein [Chloroflexota bacterium]
MPRQGLQISLVILGLVPTITGILGMFGLDDPLYASLGLPRNALLDSNLRFYSGVWFVLGITVLLTVQSLEKYFELYKILWAMIFVGGIGRLLSIAVVGLPPIPFIGFTVLEILGPPIFLYWHRQIAKVMPHDN